MDIKEIANDIKTFQAELNSQYADPERSPLLPEDLKRFVKLDFFTVDLKYLVEAEFVRTPDEETFKMKTTTDRKPEYIKYGEVHFIIDGEKFKLNVYDDIPLEGQKKDNHLFLPFMDLTNGNQTYGGGRYIDLLIPTGNTIILNFNKAYNPYCHYNHKYSCPVPPRENHLEIEILAGVKAFKQ